MDQLVFALGERKRRKESSKKGNIRVYFRIARTYIFIE